LSSQANHSQKVISAAGRWRALGILCTALVLSMTSWFSATAITPELRDTWKLSEPFLVWLTNGVQIGFVIGALASSLVNLPDIIRLNRLMAGFRILYCRIHIDFSLTGYTWPVSNSPAIAEARTRNSSTTEAILAPYIKKLKK